MALKTIFAAALVAALPSLAFAQETVKPAAPAATTGGMTMADKATVKVTYVTAQPADVMSSKLIGLNVYNNANESVGEIEDLVIVDGKTVSAVILGVGGFLGMGERYVSVSPSSITLAKKDNTLRALIDTDKDTLKSAPAFQYSKKK
ncbi:PRC-barrel domain-containing protein [Methylobacterium sp. J-090]|uniref:PRC-barrel domain-containing protein n=1 Tax=Methylobacterium sp. J-090 TaxID=2836666 RepID=UPI001FBBCDA0|nr:PRC-barrel domain-containing protein [Methylobacterium sp. J-090]MCJ2081059.1 PRC-barrel domain-containing protein [Methylobacterium sp. J-090]